MEIKEKLDRELEQRIEYLSQMTLGSDDMSKAVETISKLHELRMAEKKADDALEAEKQKLAIELKKAKDAKIMSIIGTGVTIGTFATKLAFDNLWMARGFKFEETGTFCSKIFGEIWKGYFRRK